MASVNEVKQMITEGAIRSIFEPSGCIVEHPVMQCVQLKTIEPKPGDNSTAQRYRLVMNDVRNFIQCMLASTANDVVTSGKLKKGSIVRLLKYNPQFVKEKKILIIIELEVLEQLGEHEKIGAPVQLENKPTQPAPVSGPAFYGNNAAPQQQQAQQYQSHALPSHSSRAGSTMDNLYPVESISPYTHKWTIRVRCTFKGEIKHWHNKGGEGKLFSVNLLDETGEIRATGFNDSVDRLYDTFQEGVVYYISTPCKVVFAKKQFSNLAHDYELQFDKDTNVEKADDQSNAPQVRYNVTKIGNVSAVEKDTTIDTIGILKDVGEVQTITAKTGKTFEKRDLTLVDDTNAAVRLTVWGGTAQSFEAPLESVLAFKGVKVSEFNGNRTLSLLSSGSMSVNPDIREAHDLKGWYDNNRGSVQFTAVAGTGGSGGGPKNYKMISQIIEEEAGLGDDPVFFDVKAATVYVKHQNHATMWYASCREPNCNKKVTEEDQGQWRCEQHNTVWDRPEYRYILQVNVADHTGQMWLSMFDKPGRILMGMSADELFELHAEAESDFSGENKTNRFTEAMQDATCKQFSFRVKASKDTFNDTPRVRYQVLSMNPIDFPSESRRLADIIKQYESMQVSNSDSLFM